MSIKKVYLIVL